MYLWVCVSRLQARRKYHVNHWKLGYIQHSKYNSFSHNLNYNIKWLCHHGIQDRSLRVCEAKVHAQREYPEGILSVVGTIYWISKTKTQAEQRVDLSIYWIWCPRYYEEHQVYNFKIRIIHIFWSTNKRQISTPSVK